MQLSPGQQLGRYTIIRHLASGGMARLYLAQGSGVAGFQKTLLLKVLKPELACQKKFIDMLSDEARITARLDHENIVRIYDFNEADGFRFLAMEYVQGLDLAQIMDRTDVKGEKVSPGLAAYIIMKAARGLSYAHNYQDGDKPFGIVHRDINPHNISVSCAGEVKILDFGIAKARSRISRTEYGELKGKVMYLTPEQASGAEVDNRTDLYALGMVLYELLTSVPLLKGGSDLESIALARMPDFQKPSFYVPELDPELESIVLKCLEVAPGDRFASADELEDRLYRWCQSQDEPVRAKDLAQWVAPMWKETPGSQDDGQATEVIMEGQPEPETLVPGTGEPVGIFLRPTTPAKKTIWQKVALGAISCLLIAFLAVATFWSLKQANKMPGHQKAEIPWKLPEKIPPGHAIVQSSVPGALVFQEGRFTGRSPIALEATKKTSLSVTLAGHRPWSGSANAASERGRFVKPDPRRWYGVLQLPVAENAPQVIVDGKLVADPAGWIPLPSGLHYVVLRSGPGEAGTTRLINLSPGETIVLAPIAVEAAE